MSLSPERKVSGHERRPGWIQAVYKLVMKSNVEPGDPGTSGRRHLAPALVVILRHDLVGLPVHLVRLLQTGMAVFRRKGRLRVEATLRPDENPHRISRRGKK